MCLSKSMLVKSQEYVKKTWNNKIRFGILSLIMGVLFDKLFGGYNNLCLNYQSHTSLVAYLFTVPLLTQLSQWEQVAWPKPWTPAVSFRVQLSPEVKACSTIHPEGLFAALTLEDGGINKAGGVTLAVQLFMITWCQEDRCMPGFSFHENTKQSKQKVRKPRGHTEKSLL